MPASCWTLGCFWLCSCLLLSLLQPAAAQTTNTAAIVSTDVPPYNTAPEGALTGELRVWHKITLGFEAFNTTERNSFQNPFVDVRLDVTFAAGDDVSYKVPGYYAADGNAANTGADAGPVWLVHFSPDRVGTWEWTARFVQGPNVAVPDDTIDTTADSAGYMDGARGSFEVLESDKHDGRDHRGKGLLQYVGQHHLRFAGNGEWFLKAGSDSPENFLEYEGACVRRV